MLYLPFSLTPEISWSSNSRDWKLYQRANWIKSHRLLRNLYNVCVLPFSSATWQIDKQFSPNKENSSGLVKKLKDHIGGQYTAVKRKEFWDYQMWLFSTSFFCWNKTLQFWWGKIVLRSTNSDFECLSLEWNLAFIQKQQFSTVNLKYTLVLSYVDS